MLSLQLGKPGFCADYPELDERSQVVCTHNIFI